MFAKNLRKKPKILQFRLNKTSGFEIFGKQLGIKKKSLKNLSILTAFTC